MKPNIVVIMTDQQIADVSRREGFCLDTTPFLDSLAKKGTWFDRAYTTMPACLPARVSMLTGRYPSATHARTNHNGNDAFYQSDLYDILRDNGYQTALCGKTILMSMRLRWITTSPWGITVDWVQTVQPRKKPSTDT